MHSESTQQNGNGSDENTSVFTALPNTYSSDQVGTWFLFFSCFRKAVRGSQMHSEPAAPPPPGSNQAVSCTLVQWTEMSSMPGKGIESSQEAGVLSWNCSLVPASATCHQAGTHAFPGLLQAQRKRKRKKIPWRLDMEWGDRQKNASESPVRMFPGNVGQWPWDELSSQTESQFQSQGYLWSQNVGQAT